MYLYPYIETCGFLMPVFIDLQRSGKFTSQLYCGHLAQVALYLCICQIKSLRPTCLISKVAS